MTRHGGKLAKNYVFSLVEKMKLWRIFIQFNGNQFGKESYFCYFWGKIDGWISIILHCTSYVFNVSAKKIFTNFSGYKKYT